MSAISQLLAEETGILELAEGECRNVGRKLLKMLFLGTAIPPEGNGDVVTHYIGGDPKKSVDENLANDTVREESMVAVEKAVIAGEKIPIFIIETTGLCHMTVRACLKALVSAGRVEKVPTASGKRFFYRAMEGAA